MRVLRLRIEQVGRETARHRVGKFCSITLELEWVTHARNSVFPHSRKGGPKRDVLGPGDRPVTARQILDRLLNADDHAIARKANFTPEQELRQR
jgi:hypothetical protein